MRCEDFIRKYRDNQRYWSEPRKPHIYNEQRQLVAVGTETKDKNVFWTWAGKTLRELKGLPFNASLRIIEIKASVDSAVPMDGYYIFSQHVWQTDKFKELMSEQNKQETINIIYKGLE